MSIIYQCKIILFTLKMWMFSIATVLSLISCFPHGRFFSYVQVVLLNRLTKLSIYYFIRIIHLSHHCFFRLFLKVNGMKAFQQLLPQVLQMLDQSKYEVDSPLFDCHSVVLKFLLLHFIGNWVGFLLLSNMDFILFYFSHSPIPEENMNTPVGFSISPCINYP